MSSNRVVTALPVYNEEKHVAEVLPEVLKFADHVVVIDDGSSDRTFEILREFNEVDVITHSENKGYGAALTSAFDFTIKNGFDALVTIDCDGQHQPQLIPEMIEALYTDVETPIDIVSGSRYLNQFHGDSIPPEDRRAINMQITRQFNEKYGLRLTDTFCGFKAYRKEALEKLCITEFGYAMPLQLWLQAVHQNFRIEEFAVPLIYLEEERSFGGSLDNARRRMAHYQEVIQREEQRLQAVASPCCSQS